MSNTKSYVGIAGKIVIIGFGSISKGVIPLIVKHIDISPERILVISPEITENEYALELGIQFKCVSLTQNNFREFLTPLLNSGDFLLNLSVGVASVALIEICQEQGALYLDTCIEPWEGNYVNETLTLSERSNYALREDALQLKSKFIGGSTAVLTHGANPGLVSHFVKQALINLSVEQGTYIGDPENQYAWAELAWSLGIKTIHIAERDTQRSFLPKNHNEFVNTWSVNGFVSEGCQPSELGWGTHERHWPEIAMRHDFGRGSSIYLMKPGATVRVNTWTPTGGQCQGFIITHNESISIADYLTIFDNDALAYRPTVHYAYHPCDDAILSLHELAGRNWVKQRHMRILNQEIRPGGFDELGVLLMGHKNSTYWFGSTLSIDEARTLACCNNATSLQVAAGVLGGMVWAIENPNSGVVEPDEMNYKRVLEVASQYLGKMSGYYTDWTPLSSRSSLFPTKMDDSDPWQFCNFVAA